jgi:hypothetical protein
MITGCSQLPIFLTVGRWLGGVRVGNQGEVQNQRCPAASRFALKPLRLPAQKAPEPRIGGMKFRFSIPFEAETLTLSLARGLPGL